MPTALVQHLLSPRPGGPGQLLTEDVRFASPFADYQGRETVAHLFALIPGVFSSLEAVRELRGPDDERATVLRGTAGGEPGDAILDERYAQDGRVEQVTLMLRPHAAARAAIELMGAALERPA